MAWSGYLSDLVAVVVFDVPLDQVRFVEGHFEDLPLAANSCDVVISNGAINLSADKAAVRPRQPISIPPRRGFDERAKLRQRTV
jgi:Methyltransferase domain